MVEPKRGLGPFLVNLALQAILTLPKVLPYRWRIPALGWLTARLVAPLAGYEARIRDNLALVCPDLEHDAVERLVREVTDNAGRVLAEMYSVRGFLRRVGETPLSGPGVAALAEAQASGRPIIGISGHFGNYNAARVALVHAGHAVGGLYRPMANAYFNRHYSRAMERISQPAFVQGRRGLAQMIQHLRGGNMIALITDQRDADGAELSFFGRPALTPLSAAELALKYDALLIPCYGIRQPDGLSFKVIVEEPIAHSDPETMMQAFNDSLEARVRANMGQWLWIHRRWLMEEPGEIRPKG